MMVGTDIRNMTAIMTETLLNADVIAINQDYKVLQHPLFLIILIILVLDSFARFASLPSPSRFFVFFTSPFVLSFCSYSQLLCLSSLC
jgi:hypothetical protein